MGKIKELLHNRHFILVRAAILGLLLPQPSRWTEHLTLPALAVVMTISTTGVSGSVFRSPRSLLVPALLGILMSYIVLTGFILGVSAIIIREEDIWQGFILLAIVPPAVAIISLTEYLRGNSAYSLIGTMGAYLGALIIMPLIAIEFLGLRSFELQRLPMITVLLIIIPLVISRILLWRRIVARLEPARGAITNWSFFVVFYTIVGLNQEIFVGQPLGLPLWPPLPLPAPSFWDWP